MSGSINAPIAFIDHHWHVGEDRVLHIDVLDANGLPQDMSGWSLDWELVDPGAGTAQITKTTGGGGITIGAGAGTNDRAIVVVDEADTQALAATLLAQYRHHLRRTDPGNQLVLAAGSVEIKATTMWP